MKRRRLISLFSNISIWIACIMAIVSLKPWFSWGMPFDTLLSLLFILSRIPLLRKSYGTKDLLLFEIYLVFGVFYLQLFLSPLKDSIIRLLVTILPLGLFLLTTRFERRLFIRRLINLYSIILFVSLCGFAMKTIGINLPFSTLIHPNPFYEPYKNYYFFTVYQDFDIYTRFTGIFSEPGHVGMISAILLYVNGFTLKKLSNIVMTVSLIWSFSLAGFVIYAVGLVLYLILNSKKPVKSFIWVTIGCSCAVSIAIASYSPTNDDIVTQLILRRLEFDSDKGLAGNNRNTGNFDNIYNNFSTNIKSIVGMGAEEYGRKFYGTANSSYKTFIMEYGFGSIITLAIFLLMFFTLYPSKLGAGLMIVILLSFIQRPYFLWFIECFTVISVITLFSSSNRKKSCHKAII